MPSDWSWTGEDKGQAAVVVRAYSDNNIAVISLTSSGGEAGFTCHIEEHILSWLAQSDDVNLPVLGVSHRPAAAPGFPHRLVEWREVGSVEGRITATVQTSRETRAVEREAQQDVVTYNHENFHLSFISSLCWE